MAQSENPPGAIRLIELGKTPFWRTQAVYHAVAELMTAASPDTIIICRPATPYLCLGYHQVYDAVLDRAACQRLNLPVMRRRVGGGATYLDANQLFYQCVFHHRRVPLAAKDIYAFLLAAPVAALRRLGLDARLRAVNEVEAEGRRIAGVGGGRSGEAAVVVGNLLFDFDYEVMAQVWRVPGEPFRELAAAALRERLITLRQALGDGVSVAAARQILLEEFARALGRPLRPGALTPAETRRAAELAQRMRSPEYLNLHADMAVVDGRIPPMNALKIAAGVYVKWVETVWRGRPVQAALRARDGIIEAARFQPAAGDWSGVEASLRGVPFAEWAARLEAAGAAAEAMA